MNKNIHILGAGGPAGVGLARCLNEHYRVTGDDSSPWAKLMMECDSNPGVKPDMIIAVPDSIVGRSTFRPPQDQLEICQDKAKTADLLGYLAPKTYWLRDTYGAGGAGAQMLSNFLPGDNYSVEFVFMAGEELIYFQKRRISYSVKGKTSGLEDRGSSAVSICTDWHRVTNTAREALHHLPGELNGFYGVDLKCDEDNNPKVTEINAGRLLTASYNYFYLTFYNLPLVAVAAVLGDTPPDLPEYPEGYGIIWQLGQKARVFSPDITKDWL